MNTIIFERRILAALKRYIPFAADRVYKIGDEILVYDDEYNKWKGPFIVVACT